MRSKTAYAPAHSIHSAPLSGNRRRRAAANCAHACPSARSNVSKVRGRKTARLVIITVSGAGGNARSRWSLDAQVLDDGASGSYPCHFTTARARSSLVGDVPFDGMLASSTFARPSAWSRRCSLRGRTNAESSRYAGCSGLVPRNALAAGNPPGWVVAFLREVVLSRPGFIAAHGGKGVLTPDATWGSGTHVSETQRVDTEAGLVRWQVVTNRMRARLSR